MSKYCFGVLCVDDRPDAAWINQRLLGDKTLGIEVTTEHLAVRCGLGNIDPQHGAITNPHSSAVEEAITHPLPPFGTRLVTIRPDADSVAAAVVLCLRAEGVATSAMDLKLIRWIGAVDRRGYKTSTEKHRNLLPNPVERYFAVVAIATNSGGHWPEFEDKVRDIGAILTRTMDVDEIITIAGERPRELRRLQFSAVVDGGVAFVIAPGQFQIARSWANGIYPVAVVFDPQHTRDGYPAEQRWSVISWPGYFNRSKFEEDINSAEAGARNVSIDHLRRTGNLWGGPSNIISSPQGFGHDSRIPQEVILALIKKHRLNAPMAEKRVQRIPARRAA